MAEYPARRNHFAHKLVRIMLRACAMQEIGTDGFALVTAISHTEDAKHYSGAVTFWNDQLMSIMGFSRGQLDRARAKAIEHGWLYYEPGGKGKVGRYWSLLPERVSALGDNAVDCDAAVIMSKNAQDSAQDNAQDKVIPSKNAQDSAQPSARETGENRAAFIPLPVPNPIPNTNTPPNPQGGTRVGVGATQDETPKRRTKPDTSPGFDVWFAVYPRHVAKAKALDSYRRAATKIPADELLTITRAYACAVVGHVPKDKIPYPATWLNQERWTDDPSEWAAASESRPINGHAFATDPADPRGTFAVGRAWLEKKQREEAETNGE